MVMESRIDGHRDQFPVGMRVLAVDDDPTCLRLLEALLRRCQYHVTTTSHAITALKLLRDNKNKFDLVISDVHMPDMDGFKLLELVGLEMDLPVIMLSANGDPKLVMKGVTHGACDYLLKPVRIEELKNIWQHVIRRKKFDSRDHSSDNWDKLQTETGEGGLISARSGNSDGKLNKRRKEQNENGIEEHNENENDNEDSSTHKKQRVVWTVELHQKFVAAVNQLGIDKAVPKKILDSMNVENLTRENVASHLQKYRLYLKRISSVSSPQAHMAAPFGNPDSPYLRFGSVNGFGNYHTQFQRTPGSFPPSGMLGRLNTSIGITHGSYSPRMAQLCHSQNVSNPINDWRKFQPVPLPGDQNGSMVQGMPTPSRPDQLQHDKVVNCIGDLPTAFDDSTVFSASSAFLSTQTIGSSGNSLARAHNNPFSLHKHPGGTQSRKQLGSQSSISVASSNSICSDNWQSGINSSTIQSNSLPMGDSFRETNLDPSSLGDDFSSMTPLIEKHPCAVSSTTLAPSQLQDPRRNPHCQAAHVNARENMKCSPNQAWDDQRQDNSSNSKVMFNSLHSSSPTCGVMDPLDQYLDPKNLNFPGNMDASFVTREDFVDPLPIQLDVEKSAMETTLNLKQGYLNTHWKPQNGNVCNNFGSLEDVLGAMMKQEQDDDLNVIDGDFGCDAYSIRACI